MASKALAPDHVTIHQSFDTPDFDYDNTILLFPGDDAVTLSDMSKQDLEGIKTVVLIDSTWTQTKRFMAEEAFQKLKTVVISTEKTIFWRHQQKSDTNLATIEAMFFFL